MKPTKLWHGYTDVVIGYTGVYTGYTGVLQVIHSIITVV